jgi:hypothetical protein
MFPRDTRMAQERGFVAAALSYVSARQNCPVAARWKALWPQNRSRTSYLQTARCRCESESVFKMEIPAKAEIPVFLISE